MRTADDNARGHAAYFQPLLDYLGRQSGPPFRIEIPFTLFHWEAYLMAPRFPLARGWERQLDIKYNALFYGGPLTRATYDAWLHQLAVRFVAVSDADLDYSAKQEVALIDRGLPYLRLVLPHPALARVRGREPDADRRGRRHADGARAGLRATRGATAPEPRCVRVRFSPYWAVGPGLGMRRSGRRASPSSPSGGRAR